RSIPGKNAKAFLDSIDYATPYGGHPVVTRWGDVLNPMWNDVRDGKTSAPDAARDAAPRGAASPPRRTCRWWTATPTSTTTPGASAGSACCAPPGGCASGT